MQRMIYENLEQKNGDKRPNNREELVPVVMEVKGP
jgi:hypothetical protein